MKKTLKNLGIVVGLIIFAVSAVSALPDYCTTEEEYVPELTASGKVALAPQIEYSERNFRVGRGLSLYVSASVYIEDEYKDQCLKIVKHARKYSTHYAENVSWDIPSDYSPSDYNEWSRTYWEPLNIETALLDQLREDLTIMGIPWTWGD